MSSNIKCPNCGSEISSGDRFCGNCGTKIEQPNEQRQPEKKQAAPSSGTICPLCGQENPPDAASCSSCGAALKSGAPPSAQKKSRQVSSESAHQPLHILQSWKIPAAIAVVFIVALAIVRFTQKNEPPAGMSSPNQTAAQNQAMAQEEEALHQAIEQDSKNDRALLRLANLYHDTRRFAQAIMMYDRYLAINPSNPDARVDLGISYFEMGLVDTTNREKYFVTAKDEMQKALTYNPKHQLAYYNLGMVNLHSGEIDEANKCFQKCAAIDSTTQVGKRAQQLIRQHSFTNPS